MKYRIIAIILTIAVAISGFTIKSSAVSPEIVTKVIEAILVGSATAIAGAAAFTLGENLADNLAPGGELDVQNAIDTLRTYADLDIANYVTSIVGCDGITVYVDNNGNYYAGISENLSDDELELATLIVNNLNSIPDFNKICEQTQGGAIGGSTISGGGGMSTSAYQKIKSAVGSATAELVNKKFFEIAAQNELSLINNGALPVYNFDFVGPSPTLQFGSYTTNNTSYKFGDLDLLPLCYSKGNNSQYIFDEDYIKSSGFVYHGASRYTAPHTNYGCWILFNGKLYVSKVIWATSDSGYISSPSAIHDGNSYFATDGTKLNENPDYYSTVFCDYPVGLYSTDGYKEFTLPVLPSSNEIDGDPFTTTITPGSVEIPRTEGEQAVINGINLGLISENPDLTLDENGNIVKIDGIDTAKLMELLQMIANNGTISFDSVEEYLQTITQLIRVSNTDTKTMNTVIANLNELTKAQNANIEAINANVATIAKALEKTAEAEYENADFSGLTVEHHGLVEAAEIVEGMPIVQQCKLLFNNLIQGISDNSTSNAPNFVFYWDSNKDGKTERYNVLDLSFMEQPLTNENLEDKSRFNDNMTIRQFVQYLMLLLCYVAFAIKILKKLPALIGGAGDAQDNLETIDRYK